MPTLSVAAAEVGVHEITVSPDAETVVTFGRDLDSVDVISLDGGGTVYYTLDNFPAALRSRRAYVLPGAGVDTRTPRTAGGTVVRLIASADTLVSVQDGS